MSGQAAQPRWDLLSTVDWEARLKEAHEKAQSKGQSAEDCSEAQCV